MIDTNSVLSTTLTRTAAGVFAIAMTFATVSAAKAETDEGFRANVEASIDQNLRLPHQYKDGSRGIATLAVFVGPEGAIRSVELLKSSGNRTFDREAIRTAHEVSYPASSQPRKVAMVLGFNQKVAADSRIEGERLVAAHFADPKVMLAAKTTAQQPDS